MESKRQPTIPPVHLMNDTVPVTAAGGVLFRIRENECQVLLIRRNGHWDIPKGKHEPGESISQCAVREVAEEVGSGLPILIASLGTTFHTYQDGDNRMGKTTWWYSMVLPKPQDLKPQNEEGITELKWVSLMQASAMVDYQNLREVLARFEEWLNQKA